MFLDQFRTLALCNEALRNSLYTSETKICFCKTDHRIKRCDQYHSIRQRLFCDGQ